MWNSGTLSLIMASFRYRAHYQKSYEHESACLTDLTTPLNCYTSPCPRYAILTRYTASHKRCRLCAVNMRCLTEAAPDDHCGVQLRSDSCRGPQIEYNTQEYGELLECPKHANYVLDSFPHFKKLFLYISSFFSLASARAQSVLNARVSAANCGCSSRWGKEPKSKSTTKEKEKQQQQPYK